jgi:hypothetical protein
VPLKNDLGVMMARLHGLAVAQAREFQYQRLSAE